MAVPLYFVRRTGPAVAPGRGLPRNPQQHILRAMSAQYDYRASVRQINTPDQLSDLLVTTKTHDPIAPSHNPLDDAKMDVFRKIMQLILFNNVFGLQLRVKVETAERARFSQPYRTILIDCNTGEMTDYEAFALAEASLGAYWSGLVSATISTAHSPSVRDHPVYTYFNGCTFQFTSNATGVMISYMPNALMYVKPADLERYSADLASNNFHITYAEIATFFTISPMRFAIPTDPDYDKLVALGGRFVLMDLKSAHGDMTGRHTDTRSWAEIVFHHVGSELAAISGFYLSTSDRGKTLYYCGLTDRTNTSFANFTFRFFIKDAGVHQTVDPEATFFAGVSSNTSGILYMSWNEVALNRQKEPTYHDNVNHDIPRLSGMTALKKALLANGTPDNSPYTTGELTDMYNSMEAHNASDDGSAWYVGFCILSKYGGANLFLPTYAFSVRSMMDDHIDPEIKALLRATGLEDAALYYRMVRVMTRTGFRRDFCKFQPTEANFCVKFEGFLALVADAMYEMMKDPERLKKMVKDARVKNGNPDLNNLGLSFVDPLEIVDQPDPISAFAVRGCDCLALWGRNSIDPEADMDSFTIINTIKARARPRNSEAKYIFGLIESAAAEMKKRVASGRALATDNIAIAFNTDRIKKCIMNVLFDIRNAEGIMQVMADMELRAMKYYANGAPLMHQHPVYHVQRGGACVHTAGTGGAPDANEQMRRRRAGEFQHFNRPTIYEICRQHFTIDQLATAAVNVLATYSPDGTIGKLRSEVRAARVEAEESDNPLGDFIAAAPVVRGRGGQRGARGGARGGQGNVRGAARGRARGGR
jgi:hypothetical protein